MATLTGSQLAQGIQKRLEELKKVCEGLDGAQLLLRPQEDGRLKRSFPTFWDLKDRAAYRSYRPISTGTPPRSISKRRTLSSPKSAPG